MATLAERDMILAYDFDFFALLVSSYRRTVGAEPAFFPGQRPSAAWLYDETRHPVLAHNTDPDPRFIYATRRRKLASNMAGTRSFCFPLASRPSRSTARSGRNFSMTSRAKGSPPDIPACASPSPAGASGSRTA